MSAAIATTIIVRRFTAALVVATAARPASAQSPVGVSIGATPKPVHHYVYFAQDRDRIATDSLFLTTKALEGAQVTYTWRQLEPEKDAYDFSAIRDDLAFLSSRGKKLFIQLQEGSFSASRINVPVYLLRDSVYNGGAVKQYESREGDDEHAVVVGWVARRWDPAVQGRFHKLLVALGKQFDGRVEGINLMETSVGFGDSGRLFPRGFSFAGYPDAIITNMKALRRAFPKSVAMQYGNFMPGEWRPIADKGYLRAVYEAAKESRVAMGGPDLLPYRRGQLGGPYPLMRDIAGIVPTGIAVQDGNFEDVNPQTGVPVTVSELVAFATDYLNVDYIFWGTQQPYYSQQVIPFLRQQQSLFNGKDLSGWHVDVPAADSNVRIRSPFVVRNGMLVSLGEPRGHLLTDSVFSNYRLEIEYRFPAAPGNAGVLVHASTPRALYGMFPRSIEVQMEHGNAGDFWCILEDIRVPDMERRRGPSASWGTTEGKARRIINLTDSSEKPLGEWNSMVIEAVGRSIKVWVNGDLVNEGSDATADHGRIALQSEGSEVEFRKLSLTSITRRMVAR